jgi:hypothetical protein
MAHKTGLPMIEDTPKTVSRRDFILGVIAGGAAVSTGYYLFRQRHWHQRCATSSDSPAPN